jgi:NADPH-dependent 2,4-dienoyl-CoA reductase/sulfur reductase-like enzyme
VPARLGAARRTVVIVVTTSARGRIRLRITGDAGTGRLLGAQLVGHLGSAVHKRVDTYATALFHGMTVEGIEDLDLSYTPPLGSLFDAVQMAAQAWARPHAATRSLTARP